MIKPGFFDCVHDPKSRWGTIFEDYFYLKGVSEKIGTRKFTCIDGSDKISESTSSPATSCRDWVINGLKIGSYLLGLPFFLMLVGKAIHRNSHNYTIIAPKPPEQEKNPPQPTSSTAEKTADAAAGVLPFLQPASQPVPKQPEPTPVNQRFKIAFNTPEEAIQGILAQLKWGQKHFEGNEELKKEINTVFESLSPDDQKQVYIRSAATTNQFSNVLKILPFNLSCVIAMLQATSFDDIWKANSAALIDQLKILYEKEDKRFLLQLMPEAKKSLETSKFDFLCQKAPNVCLNLELGHLSIKELSNRITAGQYTAQDCARWFYDMFDGRRENYGEISKFYNAELPIQMVTWMASILATQDYTIVSGTMYCTYRACLHVVINTPHPARDERILAFLRGEAITGSSRAKRDDLDNLCQNRGVLDNLRKCLHFKAEFQNLPQEDQERLKKQMTAEELEVLSISFDFKEIDLLKSMDSEEPNKKFNELSIAEIQRMRPFWLIDLVDYGLYDQSEEQMRLLIDKAKTVKNGPLLIAYHKIRSCHSSIEELKKLRSKDDVDPNEVEKVQKWFNENEVAYTMILKSLSSEQAELLEQFKKYCFRNNRNFSYVPGTSIQLVRWFFQKAE